MPSMLVGDIQTVAGAATYTLQPPAGEAYCVEEFSSGVIFVGDVPDLEVRIADGVHAACIVIIDPTTAVKKGGRKKEIYITNENYMEIENTGANAELGWTGYRVSPNIVITDIVTVPNTGSINIQPPAGETWKITEIGAETPLAASDNPDMTLIITNGVLLLSATLISTENRKQNRLLNWYIDHDTYLRATDTSGADNDLAISGIRVPVESIGGVVDVLAAATYDIQPPDGEEWVITELSSEKWEGAVAPAQVPDIMVALYDGALVSYIVEDPAAPNPTSLIMDQTMDLKIDHAHYLQVTNTNAAAAEIGWLGFKRRQYQP